MKVVFFGTPEWAVPSLESLAASSHRIVGVVTATDKPAGRSRRPVASPVKRKALELGLGPLLQPDSLRPRAARASILDLSPDVLVVVAYGRILPGRLLDAPPHGALNLHFSLLPRHRGASPVQHAILCGDAVTGVTIMQMDRGLDTGPVLLQREVVIEPGDASPALGARLAAHGSERLVEALDLLERRALTPRPQDDALATSAPLLTRAMAAVSWERDDASLIERKTRAFVPWPPVVATGPRGVLRLVSVYAEAHRHAPLNVLPGTVAGRHGEAVEVVCAGGTRLLVAEVQPASRRAMSAAAALSGGFLEIGGRLEDGVP